MSLSKHINVAIVVCDFPSDDIFCLSIWEHVIFSENHMCFHDASFSAYYIDLSTCKLLQTADMDGVEKPKYRKNPMTSGKGWQSLFGINNVQLYIWQIWHVHLIKWTYLQIILSQFITSKLKTRIQYKIWQSFIDNPSESGRYKA